MNDTTFVIAVDPRAWKNEPMTDKQAELIRLMESFRFNTFPRFEGLTKGEANQYITRYRKTAYANMSLSEHFSLIS